MRRTTAGDGPNGFSLPARLMCLPSGGGRHSSPGAGAVAAASCALKPDPARPPNPSPKAVSPADRSQRRRVRFRIMAPTKQRARQSSLHKKAAPPMGRGQNHYDLKSGAQAQANTLRSAALTMAISSGEPIETRHQSSIGGKGRPTSTFSSFILSWNILMGMPVLKNTKLPCGLA